MHAYFLLAANGFAAYQDAASISTCFWQQDHSAGKASAIDLRIVAGLVTCTLHHLQYLQNLVAF